MDLLQFIGRFHPVILHLPIGFLVLGFTMELYDRWRKSKQFQAAIGFALLLGVIGSIFAATTGYLLSLEGGYEENLLDWHQWLGISVVVFSVLLYGLHRKQVTQGNRLYFPMFVTLNVLLAAAGHYGGSLTHGSNFLSLSSVGKEPKKTIIDINIALVFEDLIQPILKGKCVQCHKESKTKGDLLMTTIEGLKQGGKNGALFVKGDATNSLMLQRAHLPLEDKKHMPPRGKQQLLKSEIALLTWWIEQGADFSAVVKDLEKDENIEALLQRYVVPADPLEQIQVADVRESTLQKIKSAGIPIFRVSEDSPFLKVDLARRKGVDKDLLKQLKSVSKQLISLDLGNTDIEDEALSYISNFPHLQKLYLQQTNISDEGLKSLYKLEYLSYLNLYETKMTDVGLATLEKLKNLQKLYLWKTATTEEGIANFASQKPKTKVDIGYDKSIFSSAQLRAPSILAEKDLFKDSIEVELKVNLQQVNIHYTLDGTLPDTTAPLYSNPLIIDKSTTVKAIVQKHGWETSEVATRQMIKIKYTPVDVKLNRPPNERYQAKGPKSLIDLVRGSNSFTDGLWIGYEQEHVTATLDLGELTEVAGVTVGALEAADSYIFFPKGMQVALSEDGKRYKTIATEEYPTSEKSNPVKINNFSLAFDSQSARYVRVKIESNLVNPDWHSNPGAPCWVFIDEITVE